MTLSRSVFSAVLAGALLAAGCSQKPEDPTDPAFVVAEGKDVAVTRREVDEKLDKVMQAEGLRRDMYPPQRLQQYEANIVKYLVRSQLILNQQEGVDLAGLDEQVDERLQQERSQHVNDLMFEQKLARDGWESVADFRESLVQAATIDRILEARIDEVGEPSDDEITEIYETLLPSLPEREEQVRVSHILVRVNSDAPEDRQKEKRELIDAARKRVLGGEDFAAVAKEISDDAFSAPKGGDLAYFPRGQWDGKFDEVAFSTKVGRVSKVFETPHGFHILKVTDHREPGTLTLSELRPELVSYHRKLEKVKRKMAYLDDLVEEADITYHIEMAPPLTGPAAQSGPGAGEGAVPTSPSLPNMGPRPVVPPQPDGAAEPAPAEPDAN
ncbi:MAG: peptidylprolyl isomerase [Verrucomicrobiota bacterium]